MGMMDKDVRKLEENLEDKKIKKKKKILVQLNGQKLFCYSGLKKRNQVFKK